MRFRWQDKEFEASDKPTFAEIDYAERLIRAAMDEWSAATNSRVAIFWAVRRVDPQLLSWEALGELSPDDFVPVEDEVPSGGDVDPPAVTPNGSPDTRAAAGDSSTTEETTT